MICPALVSIYEYIDGNLSAPERAAFEAHLSGCPGCRAAFEERRAIAEAASSLSGIEASEEDFVRGVMSRLSVSPEEAATAKRARRFRLAPVLTGASAVGAVGVAASLISGNGLFGIFLGAGGFLWETVLSTGQGILKAAKVAFHLVQMAAAFIGRLVEGFRIAATFIGPEAQLVIFAVVLAATLSAGVIAGRKFLWEKNDG